jgi:predicted MFS family arabinose efflux permease
MSRGERFSRAVGAAARDTVAVMIPLRRDPDFRRYWAARTVSLGGSLVTYLVLPVLVYRMTGDARWTALVTVSESLPYRLDRRRTMIVTDVLSAVVLASVPVAYLAGVLTPVHVVLAGLGVHSLFVFFDGANFGALPAVAGRERLPAANSLVHGTSTAMEMAVPVAAGAAVAVVAPAPLLAVDVMSFLASAYLVRALAKPLGPFGERAADGRLRHEIAEGLRFLVRHPVVRMQTLVAVLMNVSFGAFLGQVVPFADTELGVPPDDARLGALYASWAVGGLVASVAYPWLSRTLGPIRVLLFALPCTAFLGLMVSMSSHWLVAVVVTALWGVPLTTCILNSITVRAMVTPDRLQGRVNTVGRMLGFGLGMPVGAMLGGLLSHGYGARVALYATAAFQAAATVTAWLSPLRRGRHDPLLIAVAE